MKEIIDYLKNVISMSKSEWFFYLSLASVVISILIWLEVPLFGTHPTMAKLTGIFVGLWAPTLMALSNRYK
tara:strand:- start:292 stop:504 length:213 start_codon:yes stop_codon:yes gene_type:complete